MDVEKALLDQNLVLGRIEATCIAVQNLQAIANGRTGKLEDRVTALESANNKRLEDLEAAKNVMDGRIQGIQWFWAILIVLVGVMEPVLLHYWK